MGHVNGMESLSLLLRHETRDVHEWVEDHPFNQELFSGRLPRSRYGQYLRGLLATAESLEACLTTTRDHPLLHSLYLPDYFRSAALAEDVQHFPPGESPLPELATFLSGPVSPPRVAAMVYVRWMADLGGGQIIVRRLADAWNLEPGPDGGLSVYDFDKPVGELRHGLRAALDAIPFSEEEMQQTLSAAREVFELHEAWFSRLL